jgi:hypothetical protein
LLQIESPTIKEKNRKAKKRKNVNEKDKKTILREREEECEGER